MQEIASKREVARSNRDRIFIFYKGIEYILGIDKQKSVCTVEDVERRPEDMQKDGDGK